MIHIEIHWCETRADASTLALLGLPRLDLEPARCGACHARVGAVNADWEPCGLIMDGDAFGVICRRCFSGVDTALTNG